MSFEFNAPCSSEVFSFAPPSPEFVFGASPEVADADDVRLGSPVTSVRSVPTLVTDNSAGSPDIHALTMPDKYLSRMLAFPPVDELVRAPIPNVWTDTCQLLHILEERKTDGNEHLTVARDRIRSYRLYTVAELRVQAFACVVENVYTSDQPWERRVDHLVTSYQNAQRAQDAIDSLRQHHTGLRLKTAIETVVSDAGHELFATRIALFYVATRLRSHCLMSPVRQTALRFVADHGRPYERDVATLVSKLVGSTVAPDTEYTHAVGFRDDVWVATQDFLRAPKRAKSAYKFWCTANRDAIQEANPLFTMAEVTMALGAQWKSVPGEVKAEFKVHANDDHERFKREQEAYTNKVRLLASPQPCPGIGSLSYIWNVLTGTDTFEFTGKPSTPPLPSREVTSHPMVGEAAQLALNTVLLDLLRVLDPSKLIGTSVFVKCTDEPPRQRMITGILQEHGVFWDFSAVWDCRLVVDHNPSLVPDFPTCLVHESLGGWSDAFRYTKEIRQRDAYKQGVLSYLDLLDITNATDTTDTTSDTAANTVATTAAYSVADRAIVQSSALTDAYFDELHALVCRRKEGSDAFPVVTVHQQRDAIHRLGVEVGDYVVPVELPPPIRFTFELPSEWQTRAEARPPSLPSPDANGVAEEATRVVQWRLCERRTRATLTALHKTHSERKAAVRVVRNKLRTLTRSMQLPDDSFPVCPYEDKYSTRATQYYTDQLVDVGTAVQRILDTLYDYEHSLTDLWKDIRPERERCTTAFDRWAWHRAESDESAQVTLAHHDWVLPTEYDSLLTMSTQDLYRCVLHWKNTWVDPRRCDLCFACGPSAQRFPSRSLVCCDYVTSCCNDCLERGINAFAKDASRVRSDGLECPYRQCTGAVPATGVALCTSSTTYTVFRRLQRSAKVETDSSLVWCPTPGCVCPDTAEDEDERGQPSTVDTEYTLECATCTRRICRDCHAPEHADQTCDAAATARAEPAVLDDARPCPVCRAPVHRTSGCFHMKCASATCRRQTNFCYPCGRQYYTREGDEADPDGLTSRCRSYECAYNTNASYEGDSDDEDEDEEDDEEEEGDDGEDDESDDELPALEELED